jgi:Holliday junction resolvase
MYNTRTSNKGRVDKNHPIIREGLVSAGYFVVDTSGVGKDFPDLLAVSKADVTVLLEVKTEGEYRIFV